MIDKNGKVYRGLQAQVDYLTKKVENGGGGSTGPTVDKITALNLATGEAALTYDANNGATVVKQGRISADGNTFDVAVEDKLPIVPGDNVTISAAADGKHLKISATGGGGGGGVAGVSSFGGKTGAINVGKNLSMNGNVVNADFQPTSVVLDPDANLGTLTDNQLATLQANSANPIIKRNEYYYLNDKQYDPGTLVYSHLCYTNGKWYAKSITITISSKAWVKNINEATTVNGKSGAVNLVAGSNVSITSSGNDITISSTGGGGGGGSGTDKGFDNLSALTIAASQYASPQSAAGPFYFKGSGTAQWKDGSASTSIPQVSIQLGCDPGAGISFRAVGEGAGASCEIGLTDLAVLDLGTFETFPVTNQTLTDEQAELIEQHKYSFIKFRDSKGWNNGAAELDVYCAPVDNAIGHGGITYKSITTQGNTYTVGITVERTSGNVWGLKRYGITKEATPGGGTDIPVVTLSGTSGNLTQDQWDTLNNADVSFIKIGGDLYAKEQNISSTFLTYSLTYVSSDNKKVTRKQVKINNNKYWSTSSNELPTKTGCIVSMQNNDSSQGSTTPFYGPVFIGPGLKLNNGILSLAVSSPATVYVHNIKLSVPVCTAEQLGQDAAAGNVVEFAFYSSAGLFDNPLALWSYIVTDNNWIPTINGTLYGSIGGGETVKALTKETIEGTDYLCIQVPGGYGEVTKYYVTETDISDPTKTTLVDGFREV